MVIVVDFKHNLNERKVTYLAEVRRKKGESFESLLRRFSRRMQLSGRLIQAKKIRFYEPPKSKREMRASAIHRTKVREKREYLVRTGKLTEEDLQGGRRRS